LGTRGAALGDTNYENFAQGGKRIGARVKELGAREFYPRGVADDAVGLAQVVDPWLEGLWAAIAAAVGAPSRAPMASPPPPSTTAAAHLPPVDQLHVSPAATPAPWQALASPPPLPEPAFPDGKVLGVIRLPTSYLEVACPRPTSRALLAVHHAHGEREVIGTWRPDR
jgi:hypothetical protein